MKNKFIILSLGLVVILLSACHLTKKSTDYYGVETTSDKKFVYVIDISGSMENKAETDLQGQLVGAATNQTANMVGNMVGGPVGNILKKQTKDQLTKLGKIKKELIPSIRGLSEDSYFTIIVFENRVKMWRKTLIPATGANKNLAAAYLTNLESGGATNVSDALEKAFDLAGAGARNADTPLEVEVIFLLSDGAPTAGKTKSTNGIIHQTAQWNSAKRIKLHTIGLGDDCDKVFMAKLADENNGQFIDR